MLNKAHKEHLVEDFSPLQDILYDLATD